MASDKERIGKKSLSAAPSFSVIILNYNGAGVLLNAINSVKVAAKKYPGTVEIIVADNNSSDGSKKIASKFPGVVFFNTGANLFLTAYNKAAQKANYPWLVLVNNDMVFDRNFFCAASVPLSKRNLFAVAPKILWGDRKRINFAVARASFKAGFLKILRDGSNQPDCNQFPASASLYPPLAGVFSKEKFLALGGVDKLYFPSMWDDVDLGYCAWKRGWETLFDPACIVYHEHKGTLAAKLGNKNQALVNRNKHLFIWKNISDTAFILEYAVLLPFMLVAGTIISGPSYFIGFIEAFKKLPQALRQRKKEKRFRIVSDRSILRKTHGEYW